MQKYRTYGECPKCGKQQGLTINVDGITGKYFSNNNQCIKCNYEIKVDVNLDMLCIETS